MYTVLPNGCPAANKKAALAANSPAAILSSASALAKAAQASQLATMKTRLDAVKPLLTKLLAELPPSLTVTGLSASSPVVWQGIVQQICYRIPPSSNVNPKQLTLFIGDGSSGSYYPNSLGGGDGPLPADYQGCTQFTVSTGVPAGLYTIVLQDSTTSSIFASVSFTASQAAVMFSGLSPIQGGLLLTAWWRIDPNTASALDTVKVVNSQGTVVYWFYTSCQCQTKPTSAAVPTGTSSFQLLQLNSVPGGYTVKFYPGGGDMVAAVGVNWIPWAQMGW